MEIIFLFFFFIILLLIKFSFFLLYNFTDQTTEVWFFEIGKKANGPNSVKYWDAILLEILLCFIIVVNATAL